MKNRVLSFLLVAVLLLSLLPADVLKTKVNATGTISYAVEGGNIHFDPSTGAISGCDDNVISAVIPAEINGIPVTCIGYGAFYKRYRLTSVMIPSSVTSIGEYAFSDCNNLTSVTIPNSVSSIGRSAFSNCRSLASVTIPHGVTSIASFTFLDCDSLTSVTIPDSVTSIGGTAFCSCNSLTSVTIPHGVTTLGDSSFKDCTSLTSVTIPDSVTSIGDGAFSDCTRLASVTIPNGVTSIGNGAFSDCTSLTSVTIPYGVTSIRHGTFWGCEKLTGVTIPNSVTSIDSNAFTGCTSLTSMTIPNSVTSIGDYAFWECTNLTRVTVPTSVTFIGNGAFSGCKSLTSATIPQGVPSIGNYTFNNCTSLKNVTIPTSVTSIGNNTFAGCTSLTSVTIPHSVTSIGSYAFTDCKSLTSVIIPTCVTSIGDYAFYGCNGLTSVTIQDGVTSIGHYAFFDCNGLTSVTIPASVISIGKFAFYDCENLTKVIIQSTDCYIASTACFGDPTQTVIYGYLNSSAQSYAEEYGYPFSILRVTLTEAPSEEMLHCIFSDMSYAYIPSSFEGKSVAQWLEAEPWKNATSGRSDEEMTQIIYHSSGVNRLDVYGLLGDWIIKSVESGKSGYAAVVFAKGDHTIIAYRGSEGGIGTIFDGEDWTVDAQFALFEYLNPDQFEAALDTYLKFKGEGYITLTGHSLGGALTAYVSILEKVKGYAFDGACGHVVDLAFAYKPLNIDFTGTEDMLFTNYTDPKAVSIVGADYIQHTNEDLFPGVCYQSNEDCVKYYNSLLWTHQIYSNTRLTESGKGIEFMPVAETHSTVSEWEAIVDGPFQRQYFLNNHSSSDYFASFCRIVLGSKKDDKISGKNGWLSSSPYGPTIDLLYGGDGCDVISGHAAPDLLIPNELSGDILSGGNGGDGYLIDCSTGGTVYISDHNGADGIILNHAGTLSEITMKYIGKSADKKWHCYSINGRILIYIKATKIRFEHRFLVINENGESIGTISTEGELSLKAATRKEVPNEVPFKEIYIEGDATIHLYDENNHFVGTFSSQNPDLHLEDYGTVEVGKYEETPYLSATIPSIYHVRVSGENTVDIAVIGNNSDGYVNRVTLAEEVNLSAGETEILMEEHDVLQNSFSVVTSDAKLTEVVEVSQESLSLNVGESAQLTAKAFFPDGTSTQNIFWHSSDSSVVTCEYDDKGRCTVKAISSGEVTIYAVASDSGIAAECKVKVATVNPFNDVRESDYYYDSILWAVGQGITNGTGKGKFSPENPCTRGQIVTFLWRACGAPEPTEQNNPFSDVSTSAYYYKAVLWAVEEGITTGTGKGKFSPENTCTRGQVATFLWRAQGQPTPKASNNPFSDVNSSAYYYNAILWAVEKGVTNGTGKGRFSPDASCTRGQIVTFLYRALS